MSWENDPWAASGLPQRRASATRSWHAGRNRVLVVVGVCVGMYGIWNLVGGQSGIFALRKQADRERKLAVEVAAAQAHVAKLEEESHDIERARQERARTVYGMAADDELIYQRVPVDSAGVPLGEAGGASGTGGSPGPSDVGRSPGSGSP